MTSWTFIGRSLRFHARAHAGVLLGTAIAAAALLGALLVGDSMRGSLRQRALERLANAWFALAPTDRLFVDRKAAALLSLPGTASVPAGTARANRIQALGVDERFWRFAGAAEFGRLPAKSVWLNPALAAQLGARAGDTTILRVGRNGSLSADFAVSPRAEANRALQLTVAGIVPPEKGGDFSLRVGGEPPLNAFLSLSELQAATELAGKVNVALSGPLPGPEPTEKTGDAGALAALTAQFKKSFRLEDVDARLDLAPGESAVELRSRRVFLEPALVAATSRALGTNGVQILTYLANLLCSGTNATPYSMIAAAGPPYTPADLAADEIVIGQWLADDLHLRPGDSVAMSYFVPESGAALREATNRFRVKTIVPLEGIYGDKTLMPDFPGIERADRTADWDAGFPLVYRIRAKDEQYWKEHRGAPKAFVSLAAGQRLWASRFGSLTAIRYPIPAGTTAAEYLGRSRLALESQLEPADFGFAFEPVRERALNGVNQGQDFGQLFIGFSFFLVVSALLLMVLLYQFGLERRVRETGVLLAVGFSPGQVRRLFLGESLAIVFAGVLLGAGGAVLYAKAMLWGLGTVWRAAAGSEAIRFHAAATTVLSGIVLSILICLVTIWLALRRQARADPARLLGGTFSSSTGTRRRSRGFWLGGIAAAAALVLLAWAVKRGQGADPGAFFGAGALLLVAGAAGASGVLAAWRTGRRTGPLTLAKLGVRGCARRRSRSLATVALLGAGTFVVVATGVFRLDADREARNPESGTGGFALIAESTQPIAQDLNTPAGRESLGLPEDTLANTRFVAFRVRDGDEASCLNLSRAQRPRLLGVEPGRLKGRFRFAGAAPGLDRRLGWELLNSSATSPDEIPGIADANSIQWALGKKIGDTLDYTDERGRPFRIRLVGAVANSILQGGVFIAEREFVKRFPSAGGCRFFLADAPADSVAKVSESLTRALADYGLEARPAARQLDAFNAVQNTYLGTFQLLGGLGLVLGTAGLGILVMRNVLERRNELAVMLAAGFRTRTLLALILAEHAALLTAGVGLGILAAGVAVAPAVALQHYPVPASALVATVLAVFLNGLAWTWLAARSSLRGSLLAGLRNE